MVAPNIRCVVVEVPVTSPRAELNDEPRDLLPWADPYIARLVEMHRAAVRSQASRPGLQNELPPPLLSPDLDFTRDDRDRWRIGDEPA